jgi:hypothetical protein
VHHPLNIAVEINWPVMCFSAVFIGCISLMVGVLVQSRWKPNPIILGIWGLWILWGFGYQTFWTRLMTSAEGTVVSARQVPYPPAPARYHTEYELRTPGGAVVHYDAGGTDATLPRNIPLGTYVRKQRWHWSYEENEKNVNDAGYFFYVIAIIVGISCVAWALRTQLGDVN